MSGSANALAMTPGEILRELRVRAGLTQREVARRVGITASVLSAYERDRRQPGAAAFLAVAGACGFVPQWVHEPEVAPDRAGWRSRQ